MPIRVTAEEAAKKHAERLKASTQYIRSGVQAVTESPMEKAAQQQDKMLAKLTEAVTTGKWQAGLRRVTLQQWKDALINVGVPRIPAGVDAAHDKIVAFYRDLLPYEERIQSELEGMPDLTLEDSVARAAHWIRRMAEFRRG